MRGRWKKPAIAKNMRSMAASKKKLSRPHVTVHTLSSVDGRILTANWGLPASSKYFEEPASKIKADAWIVGRVTMEEIAH